MLFTSSSKESRTERTKLFVQRFNVSVSVIIIFIVTFAIGAGLNYSATYNEAQQMGKRALTNLEGYIQETADQLSQLHKNLSGKCSQDDILLMRQYLFNTNMIKELGAYDSQGIIYCTSNEGPTHIRLYETILARLNLSANNNTVSMTRSKTGLPTFFVYQSQQDGSGLDALIPPRHFIDQIENQLKNTGVGYQIQVLKHIIPGRSVVGERSRTLTFPSQGFPVVLTLTIGADAYLTHYLESLWIMALIAALLSLIFVLIKDAKKSAQSLDASLRNAILHNQLQLYIQPIIDHHAKRVVGGEVLLRWNDPAKGYISPAIFIPIAEQSGLIKTLTIQTFEYLVNFIGEQHTLFQYRYVSVNVSRIMLIDRSFISYLVKYSKEHPSLIDKLLLEITEDNNYSAQELDVAIEHLRLLKKAGFKTAVDDFGTGYSGLNFIHQHAFNTLKIDQVFIKSLHSNSAIDSVVVSMIKLGKQLGMQIIAEGVETYEQLAHLEELGVHLIQGFYYAKPMPVKEFTQFVLDKEAAL